jgi:glutathione peroxidase
MNTYDFSVSTADGEVRHLRDYADKVLLIVNVASECGLTPQYVGLEALYQETKPLGLEILGFPCNQFGGQEPGTDAEIQQFCTTNYHVSFPVFAKIDVNGVLSHPLYVYLRSQASGDFGPASGPLFDYVSSVSPDAIGTDAIKWNFTKFLIGRDGEVIRRYEPGIIPEEIHDEIRGILAA